MSIVYTISSIFIFLATTALADDTVATCSKKWDDLIKVREDIQSYIVEEGLQGRECLKQAREVFSILPDRARECQSVGGEVYDSYRKKNEDLKISPYNRMDSAYRLARKRAYEAAQRDCQSPKRKHIIRSKPQVCEKWLEDSLRWKQKAAQKVSDAVSDSGRANMTMGTCFQLVRDEKQSAPAIPKECDGLKVKDLSEQTISEMTAGAYQGPSGRPIANNDSATDAFSGLQKDMYYMFDSKCQMFRIEGGQGSPSGSGNDQSGSVY